jgi:predicted MFS family arabinose efflux permease
MGNSEKKPFIGGNGQVLPHGYEYKMVLICGLAIGFVMFDRMAIANLQSYIMEDVGLNYTQLGIITSVFAATWAISGVLGGYIADTKMSRKKFFSMFVLFFSVMSLLTGFCTGFIMFIIVRAVMGFFEGPMFPTGQSFVLAQSSPERRGFNLGLVQVTIIGLISTTLGPIIQVALAESIGWRWTFVVTIIPGVILTLFIMKVLVDPPTGASAETTAEKPPRGELLKQYKNRNIIVGIIAVIFLLAWYISMLTYVPGYLVAEKGFSTSEMSLVMSMFGVGAIFLGGMLLPRLSDKIGRKPVTFIGAMCGVLASFGIVYGPANLPLLCVFAVVGWGGTACCTMLQAAIPGESVDQKYAATIIGTIQGAGELIGATVGAIIFGIIGDAYGLSTSITIMGICVFITGILSFVLRETAPNVVARKAAKAGGGESA